MPVTKNFPLVTDWVRAFCSNGGASTGAVTYAVSPFRGKIIEMGFIPASLVGGTASITMAGAVLTFSDSVTSVSTQFLDSATGQIQSANTLEGFVCSAIPNTPANAFVNPGNVIKWTFSGGNAAAIGYHAYAIVQGGQG